MYAINTDSQALLLEILIEWSAEKPRHQYSKENYHEESVIWKKGKTQARKPLQNKTELRNAGRGHVVCEGQCIGSRAECLLL